MPPRRTSPRRPPPRRTLVRWLVAVVVVPVALIAILLAGSDTAIGQSRLARLLEDTLSGPGFQITIGQIGGRFPLDVTLRDVTVADDRGVWLQIDRAELDWSPFALARGEAHIDSIEIGQVTLSRLPVIPEPAEPQPAEPFALPDLPVTVRLDRFSIEQAVLAEPVLNTPAPVRLAAEGAARLGDPAEGLMLRLDARRIDGEQGTVALDLAYVPEENRLRVALNAEEPAGGVLARLAGLPGLPPVSVALNGEGPLDDWDATLNAGAGEDLSVQAAVAIDAVEGGHAVVLEGRAEVAALLDPALDPLVAGGVEVSARTVLEPEGPIAVDRLRLAAPAGAVTLDGTIDRAAGRLDLGYRVEAGQPSAYAALLPEAGWEALILAGRISGPFAGPTVTAQISAEAVASGEIAVDRATVDLRAAPSAPLGDPAMDIALTGTAVLAGLSLGDPALDALLAPTVTAELDATATPDGRVALRRAAVTLPAASLTAEGTLRDWGQVALLEARLAVPDLGALADLAGQPLGGAFVLEADARTGPTGTVATLAGTLTDPALGIPQAEALLGPETRLFAHVVASPEGEVAVNGLVVDAAQALLLADLRLGPETLAGQWSLDLPALSAVEPSVAGAVSIEGRIDGTPAAPRATATAVLTGLVAGGQTIPRATVNLAVEDLAAAPAGRIEIAAAVAGLPARIATRFAVPADAPETALRLDDLAIRLGSLGLTGTVAVEPGGTVRGRLSGGTGVLAELEPLTGLALGGAADLTVTLAAPDGRQRVEAGLTARNLAVADAVRVAQATLNATIADALGTPRLEARLIAAGVATDGLAFDRVQATAEGGLDRLAVTLALAGQPASLKARATIGLAGPETRIDLTALQIAYDGERLALTQPAAVRIGPAGIAVDRLALAGPSGQLALEGRIGGERLDLTASLANVSLALARLAAPDLALDGTLNGQVQLSGPVAAPQGSVDLRVTNARAGAATALGLPGFDASLQGQWRNRQLTARATVTAAEAGTLTAQIEMPLDADPATGLPSLAADQPLRAAIDARLSLTVLNTILAAQANRVAGTLTADLIVDGTLSNPDVTGTVRLTDGQFVNAVYGVNLSSIQATLTATGDVLTLTSLSANTPGDGSLSGSGTIRIDPAGGFPVDLRLTADRATLLASNDIRVTADAGLQLTGQLLGQSTLAGRVTIRSAELRIPEQLPPQVATIPVTEINVPPGLAARRAETEPPAAADGEPPFNPALDITLAAPAQVYVRGRGLQAELGGTLQIGGTLASPTITGDLTLRRGSFDLLGNRLNFDRGRITFLGGREINPLLDFQASTQADDITASINLTGPVSSPEISFSSDPPLPQDEVAAYLLFGRGVGELSALEAVRLAEGVAQLTGQGGAGGLLDQVRRTFGLDRLDVTTGTNGQGPGLAAGRYIAEGVYVGVQQGLESGASQVTVEIEVTPNIILETDVGIEGGSRVGVNFRWDY